MPDGISPISHRGSRRIAAERWTGNRTHVLELSVAELAFAVEQDEALVASLREDARARLRQAQLYLEVAILVASDEPSEQATVAIANAVLAGIAPLAITQRLGPQGRPLG